MSKNFDWGKLIFYIIVIIFIVILVVIDNRDVNCSDLSKTACGPGCGSMYYQGKLQPGDSSETILDKINTTARYEYNTIIWRRILITAFILSFIILMIIQHKIPKPIDFLIVALIVYGGIYLWNEYGKYNITYFAVEQMDDLTQALRT